MNEENWIAKALAASPEDIRIRIRAGLHVCHTAGLAPGKLQCNLAIVPEDYALDFLRFCLRNPKPRPIAAVGDTGVPEMPALGRDIDIRCDAPFYRVFVDGELTKEVENISKDWRDDFVAVALGCSFSFENALIRADIRRARNVLISEALPDWAERAGRDWAERWSMSVGAVVGVTIE